MSLPTEITAPLSTLSSSPPADSGLLSSSPQAPPPSFLPEDKDDSISNNNNEAKAPKGKRRRKEKPIITAKIDSMSHDGRGVAHVNGKAVFVERAITGETVEVKIMKKKKSFEEGYMTKLIEASPHRVEPKCQHFGYCGGCVTMHIAEDEQLRLKQQVLLDSFEHIGKIKLTPEQLFTPISPSTWNYRRRTRLSVMHAKREDRIFVGFHTLAHSVGDIKRCEVLHPQLATLFPVLSEMIEKTSIKDQIPNLEVSIGDTGSSMVVRHMAPMTDADRQLFVDFGIKYNYQIFLQSKGPNTVVRLHPAPAVTDIEDLSYKIRGLDIQFGPLDFFQVNGEANKAMVDKALELLDIQPDENVVDLCCGVGNFTLPIAKLAKSVVGIELDKVMVEKAKKNAQKNNIQNADFVVGDLITGENLLKVLADKKIDKVLLDPPRLGAFSLSKGPLTELGVSRIVYVSCNPSTMARDAQELLARGYKISSIGVVNMFPHTSHVESIGLFEKVQN